MPQVDVLEWSPDSEDAGTEIECLQSQATLDEWVAAQAKELATATRVYVFFRSAANVCVRACERACERACVRVRVRVRRSVGPSTCLSATMHAWPKILRLHPECKYIFKTRKTENTPATTTAAENYGCRELQCTFI